MRRMKYVLPALLVVMFLSAGVASAVTYTEMQFQTAMGQNFNFNFSVLESDGTPGYFTIEARGDYFGKGLGGDENLDFNIDGVFARNNIYFGPSPGSDEVIFWDLDPEKDDVWWKNTWTITGAELLAITSNSAGIVAVDLFPGVGTGFGENTWVKVTLEYNAVPIPGTLLLLGSGLIGLAGIRKKIKR